MIEEQKNIPAELDDELLNEVNGGVVIVTTEMDTPGIRKETSTGFKYSHEMTGA